MINFLQQAIEQKCTVVTHSKMELFRVLATIRASYTFDVVHFNSAVSISIFDSTTQELLGRVIMIRPRKETKLPPYERIANKIIVERARVFWKAKEPRAIMLKNTSQEQLNDIISHIKIRLSTAARVELINVGGPDRVVRFESLITPREERRSLVEINLYGIEA